MSTQKDPVELLKNVYNRLPNGEKVIVTEAATLVKDMQAELADLKSSLERQPLPEAPVSMTAKVVHAATQIEWLVTVREVQAARLLISAMPVINEALAEQGLIAFDSYVDSRRAERGQLSGTARELPAPASGGLAPNSQPLTAALTFEAKLLTATVNDGKAYWKVRGGRFEKFGVTVWPETLEKAGFFVNELNVMESYNLSGWVATYTTKDGDKPDKVIGLAKPA